MAAGKRLSISGGKRFKVLERDNFTCRYCGGRPPDVILEVDHIHPISLGGSSSYDNLVTSCRPCNRGKRTRLLERGEDSEEAGGANGPILPIEIGGLVVETVPNPARHRTSSGYVFTERLDAGRWRYSEMRPAISGEKVNETERDGLRRRHVDRDEFIQIMNELSDQMRASGRVSSWRHGIF